MAYKRKSKRKLSVTFTKGTKKVRKSNWFKSETSRSKAIRGMKANGWKSSVKA
tara:strand:- start:245 stop:403 length:159 start_codon:yes stop_codon:yes gene_type:complete